MRIFPSRASSVASPAAEPKKKWFSKPTRAHPEVVQPHSASTSPASALPTEIALSILAYLPPRDLVMMKLVSHHWNSAATRRLDDLSATLSHRSWSGTRGLRHMLREREAMEVSLFAPHGVPDTRDQAEALAHKAFSRNYHATALVAWQAAGRITAASRPDIVVALCKTKQMQAAQQQCEILASETPEACEALARALVCFNDLESQVIEPLLDAWQPDAQAVGDLLFHGNASVARLLLDRYDIASASTRAALEDATRKRRVNLMSVLVPRVDQDCLDACLYAALQYEDGLAAARCLFEAGAVLALQGSVTPPLLECIRLSRWDMALWACDIPGVVQQTQADGSTPWHALARVPSSELSWPSIGALADKFVAGGMLAHTPNANGVSALTEILTRLQRRRPMRGGDQKHAKLIMFFLQRDRLTTIPMRATLELCIELDAPEIVSHLAARDSLFATPKECAALLSLAFTSGKAKVFDALLAAGASPQLATHQGLTLFEWLAQEEPEYMPNGWHQMCEALAAHGVDVDRSLQPASTPLARAAAQRLGHYTWREAAARNLVKYVRFLLEHGANVHATDDRGRTALHLAETQPIAALLVKYGANPKALDFAWEKPRDQYLLDGPPAQQQQER